MKNKATAALSAIVLFFFGITLGFFLGRNTRAAGVQTTKTLYETVPGETVVVIQEILVTAPPETTAPAPPPTKPVQVSSSETPKATKPKEPEVTFPVNINTASLRELDALPGIGEVLGQRIIDYRKAHGPFTSIDQLLNIKGIGEKTLAKLKPYVTL